MVKTVKQQVLDIIEDEIKGYNKWLKQTSVYVVNTILMNNIDVLQTLAKRIKKEIKEE